MNPPQDTATVPEENANDPKNHDLPEDLQAGFRALAKKFSGREIKDRRFELRRVRKARFFWRGVQHLLWNDDAQSMVVGQYGAASLVNSNASAQQPTFMRDFNIYTPYGKSFMATFCGNQPATRFEPEDPTQSVDIRTAEASNNFRRVFEKWNPPKMLQAQIARLLWTDDRVVVWTRYEQDGERFGYDDQNQPRRPRSSDHPRDTGAQMPHHATVSFRVSLSETLA